MHNVVLAFTRNVVGSVDYTPVTWSDYNCCKHKTTNAHELALAVIFESGLLHYADRAEPYLAVQQGIKYYMKSLPVTWDQTKLLQGSPESHIVVARKKGNIYYVAGIQGGTTRTKSLTLDLSFVGKPEARLTLIKDGNASRDMIYSEEIVKTDVPYTLSMLPAGGFSMRLE